MVRNYKPVGGQPCQRPYIPEDLQSALVRINAVENLWKVSIATGTPGRLSGFRGKMWSTGGSPTALMPTEERCIAQHVAVLGYYGYAFDELELRLFVKSFIVKVERSVAQFKDNLPGVDWVRGFMKPHKDLLTKRIKVVDHADS